MAVVPRLSIHTIAALVEPGCANPAPSLNASCSPSEAGPGGESVPAARFRRHPSFVAPPPDIYLNRTLFSTPSGELSLEDLFHDIDSNNDGKISALHELPLGLTVMGLYWDEELGNALLADRTGVDTLEEVLAGKCGQWWSDERNVPSAAALLAIPETAGGEGDVFLTSGSRPVVSSGVSAGVTRLPHTMPPLLVSVSQSTEDSMPRSEVAVPAAARRVPPPPPPKPRRSGELVALPMPPTTPKGTAATTLLEGSAGSTGASAHGLQLPVTADLVAVPEDRTLDWTTFCTIIALLQASGAYKQVIRQILRRQADIASAGQGRGDDSDRRRHRRTHRRSHGSAREGPRPSLIAASVSDAVYEGTGDMATDMNFVPDVSSARTRHRSRSDADARLVVPTAQSPLVSGRSSKTSQSPPARGEYPLFSARTTASGRSLTLPIPSTEGAGALGGHASPPGTTSNNISMSGSMSARSSTRRPPEMGRDPPLAAAKDSMPLEERQALQRMTALLKARNSMFPQHLSPVQGMTSPHAYAHALGTPSGAGIARALSAGRMTFYDVVSAAMSAHGVALPHVQTSPTPTLRSNSSMRAAPPTLNKAHSASGEAFGLSRDEQLNGCGGSGGGGYGLPPRTPVAAGGSSGSGGQTLSRSSSNPLSPPSATGGALFRHTSIRRLTQSPGGSLPASAKISPGSSGSSTSNAAGRRTSIGSSSETAAVVSVGKREPTARDHLSRPSRFSFNALETNVTGVSDPGESGSEGVHQNLVTPHEDGGAASPSVRLVGGPRSPLSHTRGVTAASFLDSVADARRSGTTASLRYSGNGMDAIAESAVAASSAASHLHDVSDTDTVSTATTAGGGGGGTHEPLHEVFLGGACNPTMWRMHTAIPFLEREGISYYNPQVDDWYPALVLEEAKAKDAADVIFFVVGPETRAIASMIEVAELISMQRPTVLVLQDVAKDAVMCGHPLQPDEIKDLNRGRAYLANVADRHGVTVYQSIEAALQEVVALINHQRELRLQAAIRSHTPASPGGSLPAEAEGELTFRSTQSRRGGGAGAGRAYHGHRMSTITAISSVTSLDPDDPESDLDEDDRRLLPLPGVGEEMAADLHDECASQAESRVSQHEVEEEAVEGHTT